MKSLVCAFLLLSGSISYAKVCPDLPVSTINSIEKDKAAVRDLLEILENENDEMYTKVLKDIYPRLRRQSLSLQKNLNCYQQNNLIVYDKSLNERLADLRELNTERKKIVSLTGSMNRTNEKAKIINDALSALNVAEIVIAHLNLATPANK